MKSCRIISFAVLLVFVGAVSAAAQDTCYATGDFNGDGNLLSVSDLIAFERYLNGDRADTIETGLYIMDLNGDCHIDYLDLELFQCYFEYGLSCFENGQFPVPTCCDPDTTRGPCCFFDPDTCLLLAPENCEAMQGNYGGDFYACDFQLCCCNLPGDANNDGQVNILDIVFLVEFMYLGGESPSCYAEAQIRGSNTINILEVTYLISFLYQQGPAPICGMGT